jgi:hypothetical protein
LLERRASQYIKEQEGFTQSFFEEDEDTLVHDFVSMLSNSQLQVIGPELIFGTLYYRHTTVLEVTWVKHGKRLNRACGEDRAKKGQACKLLSIRRAQALFDLHPIREGYGNAFGVVYLKIKYQKVI